MECKLCTVYWSSLLKGLLIGTGQIVYQNASHMGKVSDTRNVGGEFGSSAIGPIATVNIRRKHL